MEQTINAIMSLLSLAGVWWLLWEWIEDKASLRSRLTDTGADDAADEG